MDASLQLISELKRVIPSQDDAIHSHDLSVIRAAEIDSSPGGLEIPKDDLTTCPPLKRLRCSAITMPVNQGIHASETIKAADEEGADFIKSAEEEGAEKSGVDCVTPKQAGIPHEMYVICPPAPTKKKRPQLHYRTDAKRKRHFSHVLLLLCNLESLFNRP